MRDHDDGQPAACSNSKHGIVDGQRVSLRNVRKTKLTNSKCILCGKLVTSGVTTLIPHYARMDLLIFHSLYVHKLSRICRHHLEESNLKPDIVINLDHLDNSFILVSDTSDIIQSLIELMQEKNERPYMDFSDININLSDADYKTGTGWSKCELADMLKCLDGNYTTNIRDKRNALAMFWIKLKTGLSCNEIAVIFNMDTTYGHQQVSETIIPLL